MTDRELLDRIRAVEVELSQLIVASDDNSKYHTKRVLGWALREVQQAAAGLEWHAEGE